MATTVIALALSISAYAQTTLPAGGDQPFNHLQPGLVMHHVLATIGAFPSDLDSPDTIATVHLFAGQSPAYAQPSLQGQVYPKAGNAALLALIGTNYGGDATTFNLPDLRGRFTVGTGTPNWGQSALLIGQAFGNPLTQLTATTLPQHQHSLGDGSVFTPPAGGTEPISLLSPALPMTYIIAAFGNFPNANSSMGSPMIGMIRSFAGNSVPGGWLPADGRLINIEDNDALFQVLGAAYGGDGVTTFALPDLRGRLAVGHGSNAGVNLARGQSAGLPEILLDTTHLPSHTHELLEGGSTHSTGGSQPFSNLQPSVGIKYLIVTSGINPSLVSGSFDPESPTLGEVIAYAGSVIPSNTQECAGQLLSISTNQNLYSLLGTAYGGDGVSNFALPDLRGRAPIGVGNGYTVGQTTGAATTTLSIANMSAHTHTLINEIFDDGFE